MRVEGWAGRERQAGTRGGVGEVRRGREKRKKGMIGMREEAGRRG